MKQDETSIWPYWMNEESAIVLDNCLWMNQDETSIWENFSNDSAKTLIGKVSISYPRSL